MEQDKTLVQEVTDLLMDKGCTINYPAMLELAIFIIEREKLAIKSLEIIPISGISKAKSLGTIKE